MILDSLLAAFRSDSPIENPRVPLSQADDELNDVLGGPESSAGVRVSRETALTLPALWRGVNLVSRDVAKLPLHVYRRTGEDSRERAVDHPAYLLLRRRPNSEQTAFVFKQTLMGHALLTGGGFAYVFRDGAGNPLELIPLLPERTWPIRVNRRLWYMTMVGEESRTLRPEDVFHLRGFTHDGINGYNVVGKARESLGWAIGMRRFSASFFRNGARASGVLMTAGAMDETAAENLLKSFNEKNAGLKNAHKTILLEEGAKYQPTTVNQDEAQFLQSMEFSLLDVANLLQLAPHKVGHPSRTSFNSLQEENQRHLDEAIDPWLVNFEEEAAEKLLTEEEKRTDSHYVEFNRKALVRVDYRTQIEGRSKQILSGELSPDEARAMDNLPPRADGLGGRYWMPTNMQFADQAAAARQPKPGKPKGAAAKGAEDDDDESGERKAESGGAEPALGFPLSALPERRAAAVRALMEDAGGRIAARLANEARRAAKKPEAFVSWLDELDGLRGVLVSILAPAVGVHAASIAADARALTERAIDRTLSAWHDDLLTVAGQARPDELARKIDAHLLLREAFGPAEIANLILEGQP